MNSLGRVPITLATAWANFTRNLLGKLQINEDFVGRKGEKEREQ